MIMLTDKLVVRQITYIHYSVKINIWVGIIASYMIKLSFVGEKNVDAAKLGDTI